MILQISPLLGVATITNNLNKEKASAVRLGVWGYQGIFYLTSIKSRTRSSSYLTKTIFWSHSVVCKVNICKFKCVVWCWRPRPGPQEAPGPGLRLGDRGEAGAGGDGNEATASDLVHIFRHNPSSPSLSSLATREWARASQMDLTGLLAHSNPFIDSRKESKALAPQTFVKFRATLNVTF